MTPSACTCAKSVKIPLLNAQQELELAQRVVAGDKDAKDKMAEANMRLVVSIAKRYVGRRPGFARPYSRRQYRAPARRRKSLTQIRALNLVPPPGGSARPLPAPLRTRLALFCIPVHGGNH